MFMLSAGFLLITSATLFNSRSFAGGKALRQLSKWEKKDRDIWTSTPLEGLVGFTARFVYLDKPGEAALTRRLRRADIQISAKHFTARKYIIIAFTAIVLLFCVLLKFWLGVFLSILLGAFLIVQQREMITSKIKEKDEAIAIEMPRFVRTICRNLRSSRDILTALESYRKVSGPVLGEELDILLTHMRTGDVVGPLQEFQTRIGTEEAFRLCSTLIEIDRGIDQIATLDFLADDMATQTKLNIQKILSVRPSQMRKTYIPAVLVCIVMIFYVLVVFVTNQLNNIL